MAKAKVIPIKPDPFEGKCARCTLYRQEPGEDWGLCHRYPPAPMGMDEETGAPMFCFPGVDDSDFCGEFKPALS